MKRICAILSLDEKTKIKIQNYRDLLTIRYGVSKKILYPHITIAHYISIDMEEIIKYTGDFVKEMNAFNIQYGTIEILEDNCIACMVNPDNKITEFYNMYHHRYDEHCDKWTKKENKLWVPHSTIYGKSNPKLAEMKASLEDDFIPFKAKVIGLELSLIKENGYQIIFSKEFK